MVRRSFRKQRVRQKFHLPKSTYIQHLLTHFIELEHSYNDHSCHEAEAVSLCTRIGLNPVTLHFGIECFQFECLCLIVILHSSGLDCRIFSNNNCNVPLSTWAHYASREVLVYQTVMKEFISKAKRYLIRRVVQTGRSFESAVTFVEAV